jgi:hypothetical protein
MKYPDSIFMKLTGLFRHNAFQEMKDTVDFLLRAVPVLCGKGIKSYISDAVIIKKFQDRAYIIYPRAMPFQSGQAALLSPSAVTVQNKCNMAGNFDSCFHTRPVNP